MGATATGKTDLAVEISRRFPVEIISVDSALIYRQMNIGTAKPSPEILSLAPHYLVDIIDAAEQYSVWKFIDDASQLIHEIIAKGRIPMLVGGSMMYYHALEKGLNQLPVADIQVREKLSLEASETGWQALHDRLAVVDPDSAARIKPGDSQRIQRALEVFEISGLPLTQLQKNHATGLRQEVLKIILNADDRASLHARIEHRFLAMIEQGFVDEVKHLRQRPDLNLALPSMRCVGYRQVWQYLDGNLNREDMIYKSIVATRQLAKRQMTWLRKQPQDLAFNCLSYRKGDIFDSIEKAFPNS
jgi:tRNA dimethylallyltransferase